MILRYQCARLLGQVRLGYVSLGYDDFLFAQEMYIILESAHQITLYSTKFVHETECGP